MVDNNDFAPMCGLRLFNNPYIVSNIMPLRCTDYRPHVREDVQVFSYVNNSKNISVPFFMVPVDCLADNDSLKVLINEDGSYTDNMQNLLNLFRFYENEFDRFALRFYPKWALRYKPKSFSRDSNSLCLTTYDSASIKYPQLSSHVSLFFDNCLNICHRPISTEFTEEFKLPQSKDCIITYDVACNYITAAFEMFKNYEYEKFNNILERCSEFKDLINKVPLENLAKLLYQSSSKYDTFKSMCRALEPQQEMEVIDEVSTDTYDTE